MHFFISSEYLSEKKTTKGNGTFLAKNDITFTSNLDEQSVCLHLSKSDQLKCI